MCRLKDKVQDMKGVKKNWLFSVGAKHLISPTSYSNAWPWQKIQHYSYTCKKVSLNGDRNVFFLEISSTCLFTENIFVRQKKGRRWEKIYKSQKICRNNKFS